MILPIGIDCGVAQFLKDTGLRKCSLPFVWTVTYKGVATCIEDDFTHFMPDIGAHSNHYGMTFPHDFKDHAINNDIQKYIRRIDRFKSILETNSEPVVFIRKGHASHNHSECDSIKHDIEDAEELDAILSKKYPKLQYTIIVMLICGSCFDASNVYISVSNNITICNIAMASVDDTVVFKHLRSILESLHLL